MKLSVKLIGLTTGGSHMVSVISKQDADRLDLHPLDRIKVCAGGRIETTSINIDEQNHLVKQGQIGILEGTRHSLCVKNKQNVSISLAKKPLALEFIRKKLDGRKLDKKEIKQIVWDISHNKLNDTELTYFVAACYTNALDTDETVMLTKAMAEEGDILTVGKKVVVDKHCIGGIPGNRTTMILVPLLAAAGITIPKTSSRSITSPAGTADTMEVLAPVSLSLKKMKGVVDKIGACMVWGGALKLAPADDKIIHVEKPLEIDAESQLLASIMAKKLSVSSTHILIDIPAGRSAKVKGREAAKKLRKQFEELGRRLRRKVKVMITDGSQPIGNGIGPALEARDVLWLLKRDPRRPLDLEKKCLKMAAEIFHMAGMKKDGKDFARFLLDSGKAYEKMVAIIKAQGGKEIPAEDIPLARLTHDIVAPRSGEVKHIDNMIISRLARIAGAPSNQGAGLYLHKHVGERCKRGEPLFTIYSNSREKLKYTAEIAKKDPPYGIK